jgi:hypothetical protein
MIKINSNHIIQFTSERSYVELKEIKSRHRLRLDVM